MVVKPLKQSSNIQKTYTKQVFEHSQTECSYMFVIYRKSNFPILRKSRKSIVGIFGCFIFLEFGIIYIFHCLGSRARGHIHFLTMYSHLYFSTQLWSPFSTNFYSINCVVLHHDSLHCRATSGGNEDSLAAFKTHSNGARHNNVDNAAPKIVFSLNN